MIFKNYKPASSQFLNAIDQIDKSIQNMQKIIQQLQNSINNLKLANNKAEDVSIKSLTHNNPTISSMFDSLKNN